METQDKRKLKIAESTFKSVKNHYPQLHRQLRDEVVRKLVKSETPDWGSLRFTVTKNGI